MAFAVDLCKESDMPSAFRLVSETFQHEQPYFDAVWPAHWESKGRKQGADRLAKALKEDPTVRFVKATEPATGQIVGLARWYIFKEKPIEDRLEGDFWGDEDSKAYAAHLYEQYLVNRRAYVKSINGPVVSLDQMTVHPDYQYEGAGTQLMQWGLKVAEGMNAPMTVESSISGRHLYEKHGFQVLQDVELQVPEKWADKPKVICFFMHRPQPSDS